MLLGDCLAREARRKVVAMTSDPARYLQSLGFKALATTSSDFAWSRAIPTTAYRVTRHSLT